VVYVYECMECVYVCVCVCMCVCKHLRAGNARLVSSGVVTLPNGSLGFTKALLVRGPDGHALRLVQR